jgi:hypothetical protein
MSLIHLSSGADTRCRFVADVPSGQENKIVQYNPIQCSFVNHSTQMVYPVLSSSSILFYVDRILIRFSYRCLSHVTNSELESAGA